MTALRHSHHDASLRGVVGRTSSRADGLGNGAQLLPAEPGRTTNDHRSDTLLVACAWCGRYRAGRRWTVLIALPPDAQVSHGICPQCLASVGCDAVR